MQILILFFGIIISFIIGFKIGRSPKKVSAVSLWNRVLNYGEVVTLYKAYQIGNESYSQKI